MSLVISSMAFSRGRTHTHTVAVQFTRMRALLLRIGLAQQQQHHRRGGVPGRLTLLAQFSSISSTGSPHQRSRDAVAISFPAVCVWGANTGVGKTLVSAGLVAAAVRNQVAVQYVKPVQTGYPADSDSRLVAAAASSGGHAAAARQLLHGTTTLYGYKDPVSPHLAAVREGRVIPDGAIVSAVAAQLQHFSTHLLAELGAGCSGSGTSSSSGGGWQQPQWASRGLSVVETAGGVTSPGPSGTLQGDLLRPLALPALLVGDPQLGGISTTLSAYESLLLRGARVAAVVMMDDGRLSNVAAVAQHLKHAAAHRLGQELPIIALPLCKPPPRPDQANSNSSSGIDAELAAWLAASAPQFDALLVLLQQQHAEALMWLAGAPGRAAAAVWWPFTQHAQLPDRDITVVDGRSGEDWLVFKAAAPTPDSSSTPSAATASAVLTPLHDAASSWWTQSAATAAQQLEVCRAVAAAAGRYMHVMWPQVVHAPGLTLTEALLAGPLGAGWASRAFFSDDGSTAVEVALKMAFRKFAVDHRLTQQLAAGQARLEVLALTNSYHGDTLGAMDCAAASPFNGPLQTPWYSGRGLFLDPPHLALVRGTWTLRPPAWLQQQQAEQQPDSGSSGWTWDSQAAALDVVCRLSSPLAKQYQQHIEAALDAHEAGGSARLAALLMEPVLQGAGGMLLVDPLFQAVAVQVARRRRVPVIYDEVFTGCWRLGPPTAGALLGEAPDIACYAKLLTGGVAPLAVTLASERVFDAFRGDTKAEALLHGHSYTAYPVGCAAALASLAVLQDAGLNPNVCTPRQPGRCRKAGPAACAEPCGQLLPMWDEAAAADLSRHSRVAGVVVLGSVLAVELADAASAETRGGRYGSAAAAHVVAGLRERGIAARPLGPVVYLMAAPTSSRQRCQWLTQQLGKVLARCEDEGGWGDADGVLI